MKLGKNQPCPCGSEKKYKKCCLGKLSPELERYYGLLHREGVIKDKLMGWTTANFSEEELNDFSQLFKKQNFRELIKDEQEGPGFFDWLFMEAIHPEKNKRVLEVIYEEAGLFEDDELKIIDQWLHNTQAGIYEIQEVNEDKHTFRIKEIYTGKEYEILDVRGSAHVVKGDVFFCRVQEIFSKYYLSGILTSIPRMTLEQFKEFIQGKFKEEKKKEPSLSYEEFMNTQGRIINDFSPKKPKLFTASGEPVNFCEAVYSLEPEKAAELIDKFAKKDKFLITNEEYGRKGEIKAIEIARIGEEREPGKEGLVTSSHWINEEGEKISTAGSLKLKDGKLTIFSLSKEAHKELKEEVEKNFKDYLQLEKEETQSAEEALAEKKDAWEEDDLKESEEKEESEEESEELKEIGKEFMEQYYKEWCDMKIPALGNKTPRGAIKTEEGKKQVKELLLDMENMELHKKKRGEAYLPIEKIIREELNFYD